MNKLILENQLAIMRAVVVLMSREFDPEDFRETLREKGLALAERIAATEAALLALDKPSEGTVVSMTATGDWTVWALESKPFR